MKIILMILILMTFLLIGCTSVEKTAENAGDKIKVTNEGSEEIDFDWKAVELYDVNSKTNFKISDFAGQKVLLETFAVWCPTCTRQQQEVRKLHEQGSDVISISLDVDPNEDEARIIEHTERNGFTWRYAKAPVEMSQALIDEFGFGVVNAPQAPMILICEDQTTRFISGRGVKSVSTLINELNQGC